MKDRILLGPMIPQDAICQDVGQRIDCLGIPDPTYTMSFEDIGAGFLYWCSFCGPQAHAMNDWFQKFALSSKENFEKLEDLVLKAEQEIQ